MRFVLECSFKNTGVTTMKKKWIYITLIPVVAMGFIGILALTTSGDVKAAVASSNSEWIDNFDSAILNSRWNWVRENPTYWSLTADPGFLQLVTRGSLNETSNNLENILLTSTSDIDYRIITKVNFSPIENFHRAGLLVYQDDDNYLQLTRVYSDGSYVRIKTEIGGVTSTIYAPEVVSDTTLYLRIDKQGNDYYGFYSLDGITWEFVGQENLPLSNTSVGLFAANGPTPLEINADFDFFKFTPRTFNNSWSDDFSSSTLDTAWSWVNEDPTHWSLNTNPGFLRITTQNGGMLSGDYHNLLIMEPTTSDYQITTKATITPTENFQGASIIVFGDDDNYVRVSRRFGGLGDEINLRQYTDGLMTVNFSIAETATTVNLRIIKEGEIYTGYYSTDGSSYTYIGQTTSVMTNPKVGLVSENGPSTTEIPSDYDFFVLENNLHKIYLPFVIR
jgi:cytochrome c